MTSRSPLARLSAVEEPREPEPGAARLARRTRKVRQSAPRRPDVRLLLGSVLIIISVILGAVMLGKPDSTVPMWVATRDLPEGTLVLASDIAKHSVDSPMSGYLSDSDVVVGSRLARPVAAGELIHASAISTTRIAPATRLVTVAVDALHAPSDLQRGQRVDLWTTPVIESVISAPQLVMANLFVSAVPAVDERGISSSMGITLEVPLESVGAVIAALRSGDIDVVRVPQVVP